MARSRDDFSASTIRTLAMRVGFLCSNPTCRTHTVGPNEETNGHTSIGVAAHMTAAAEGGPRYNPNLGTEERRHINNGIWLCANCSVLIDRNPNNYTVDLLNQWKNGAELEMLQNIQGRIQIQRANQGEIPFIDTDIVFNYGSRRNTGYSMKNPIEEIDGRSVMTINAGALAIIHWDITRNFQLIFYNNSSQNAYNLKVEIIGDIPFASMGKLQKINAVPALKNIEMDVTFRDVIEDTHIEADKILRERIPQKLDGLHLKVTYVDNARNEYELSSIFQDGQFVTKRVR